MVEATYLKNQLSKAFCTKCGSSLGTAKIMPVGELPLAVVAHAVCLKCNSENMVTITSLGTGVMATVSDLTSREVKKFINVANVSHEDVLSLHKLLKKKSICNLLQKKEQH
jgi:hypothetical protein